MKTPILSVEQAKKLDQLAIDEFGFPSILLMENAGRGLANVVIQSLQRFPRNTEILILCGPGSNGGDGFVAARHLFLQRFPVTVFSCLDVLELKGDTRINANLAVKLNVPIRPLSQFIKVASQFQNMPLLIIDALFGTGFHGEISSPIKEVIEKINNLKKFHNAKVYVVSADIPSGLHGDTGVQGSTIIHADITVGMGSIKKGLMLPESRLYVGKQEWLDIGIPETLYAVV